jgi:hypothetical protein
MQTTSAFMIAVPMVKKPEISVLSLAYHNVFQMSRGILRANWLYKRSWGAWQDFLADGRHRATGILPVANFTGDPATPGRQPVPRALPHTSAGGP